MTTSLSSITVSCVLLVTALSACSPLDDQGVTAAQGPTTLQGSAMPTSGWRQSPLVASNQGGYEGLQCPEVSGGPVDRVLIFVLDRSGSMNEHPKVLKKTKHEMEKHVRKAPPATAVWVQYASSNSLALGERIFLGVVPDPGEPSVCKAGALDPVGKKQCWKKRKAFDYQYACAAKAKETIAAKIRQLQPNISQSTDFWGAIGGVNEVLQTNPHAESTLVIYSDGKDTRHLQLPKELPGLSNTTVFLRLIREEQPKGTNALVLETARVKHLTTKFNGWGAKSVKTILMDIPFTHNIFPDSPTQS